MKYPLLTSIALLIFGTAFGLDHWETDLKTAQEKAARENKGIILVYRGKDWKPGEYGRPETMFTMERFLTPAMKNYILLEQPYPETSMLKDSTLLLFSDEQGRPFRGLRSELDNGVQMFCEELERAELMRPSFEKLVDRATNGTGDEKHKAVGELINLIDSFSYIYYPHYKLLREDTKATDQKDVSGLKRMENGQKKKDDDLLKLCLNLGIPFFSGDAPLSDEKKMKAFFVLGSKGELNNPSIPDNVKTSLDALSLSILFGTDEYLNMNNKEFAKQVQDKIREITDNYKNPKHVRHIELAGSVIVAAHVLETVKKIKDSDPGKAVSILETALQEPVVSGFDISRQLLQHIRATFLLRAGNYDESILLLEKARDIDPSLADSGAIEDYLKKIKEKKQLILELLEERKNGNNTREAELDDLLKTPVDYKLAM